MMRANQAHYKSTLDILSMSEKTELLRSEWNSTTVALISAIAHIFAQRFEVIRSEHDFARVWNDLLNCLNLFLDRDILSLSTSIFTGLTEILEEVDNVQDIGTPAVDRVWELWEKFNPVSTNDGSKAKSGTQDAMMAYLRCIPQIYRLMSSSKKCEHAGSVIHEIQSCVAQAEVPDYSSDIDRMTPVQKGVLENLKIIPLEDESIRNQLVDFVASLVTLPYEYAKTDTGRGPTFLALSTAAITALQTYVIRKEIPTSITSFHIVTRALQALAVPIHLKYSWHTEENRQSSWKRATTAAVQLLEPCIPLLTLVQQEETQIGTFWDQVVKITDGVVAADCEYCENSTEILKDQEFDIEAASKILKTVTPALGNSCIPDGVRRHLAEVVFEKSLVHEPHPDDLAQPGQGLLEGLKYDHIGRTQDLPPTARFKMSYFLLDELFKLVAASDGSAERIRLAQAVAPYLVLRCGLTLKAYVYDQPLRGRMPQPWSQKREMFCVLKKMSDLEIEPKAMQDVPDMVSEHKKHLIKLYPLLTRALKAALRDEEMTKALGEVLELLEPDFGL